MEQQQTEIRVLRVAEGSAMADRGPDGTPNRIFSVVLSRPAGEDLGIVASAVDPANPQSAIPTPQSKHPTMPGYVAMFPIIYSVGLRSKDGAMLALCSNFYNVRVRYERTVAGSQESPTRQSRYGDGAPVAGGKTERAAGGLASQPATGYGLPATGEATEGSAAP